MRMINEITHSIDSENNITKININSERCLDAYTMELFFNDIKEYCKSNDIRGFCKIHAKCVSGYVSRPVICCELWWKKDDNHQKKYGGLTKDEFLYELGKYPILYKLNSYSDTPQEIAFGFREFMMMV
jgi:hypothetical protein